MRCVSPATYRIQEPPDWRNHALGKISAAAAQHLPYKTQRNHHKKQNIAKTYPDYTYQHIRKRHNQFSYGKIVGKKADTDGKQVEPAKTTACRHIQEHTEDAPDCESIQNVANKYCPELSRADNSTGLQTPNHSDERKCSSVKL